MLQVESLILVRFLTDLTFSILQVSLAARQLIHALLNRDPASRLGSNTGANEIKEHLFFRGLNWPLIRHMVVIFPSLLVLKAFHLSIVILELSINVFDVKQDC